MSSNSLEHGGDGPVEGLPGGTGVLPGGPGVGVTTPGGKQLTVTPEEMQIFQQCRRESFFYRCLPLAGVFGLATNRLLAAGFLKTGRFGTGPKYMLAAIAGWVLGKWSYMKTCENKFLLLENSNIGDLIRKRRGMVPIGGDGPSADHWGTPGHEGSGTLQAPDMGYGQYKSPGQSSEYGSYSSFGKDSPGAFRDTEEDLSGPVEAFGPMSVPEDEQSKKYMTYEELRKRNRDSSPPPVSPPPQPSFQPAYRIGRDGNRESIEERSSDAQWKKNQYGDLYRD
ncbi:OCIA domain-containing protein 1-like [Branchiostoma floridae x Branchiostoma belcheri]